MDLGLHGRVVLVCGGSRGIGFATAQEFVREGLRVAICGRDDASLATAATRLGSGEFPVLPVVADLATDVGVRTAVQQTLDRFGQVDVLITNTGGPPTGTTLSHDWPAWQAATDLLLRSAVELCRALVPAMRERQWGRVVGITSFAVKQPVESLVLSNALRAAVTGFFRTLASEVAADGVTVNTVLPGYTETERLVALAEATTRRTGAAPEAVYDAWRAETPAGRLGAPEEVAAMIVFLASARAGFVTGQSLCVDGGAVRSLL